jgi:hypothetical protein
MDDQVAFDGQVRREVYDACMRRGAPPMVAEIATALGVTSEQAREALGRLATGRVVVLQPDSGEILMANPFSAVPTPFPVRLEAYSCYANCIWDALGVAAMLRQDAHIQTACGDCGQALELHIAGGQAQGEACVIHFAVPARRWWEDIVFT